MKQLVVVLFLCAAANATAETFQSPQGYAFEVPGGWEPVPPEDRFDLMGSDVCVLEGAWGSDEAPLYVETYWAAGADAADALEGCVLARSSLELEAELAQIAVVPLENVRIIDRDAYRQILRFTCTVPIEGKEVRIFFALKGMRDGVCILCCYTKPDEEPLRRPTFDQIVESLTVSRERDRTGVPLWVTLVFKRVAVVLLAVGVCAVFARLRGEKAEGDGRPCEAP